MALNVFGLITRIRDVTTYPFDVYASKQHVRMSNSTARLDPRQFSFFLQFDTCARSGHGFDTARSYFKV